MYYIITFLYQCTLRGWYQNIYILQILIILYLLWVWHHVKLGDKFKFLKIIKCGAHFHFNRSCIIINFDEPVHIVRVVLEHWNFINPYYFGPTLTSYQTWNQIQNFLLIKCLTHFLLQWIFDSNFGAPVHTDRVVSEHWNFAYPHYFGPTLTSCVTWYQIQAFLLIKCDAHFFTSMDAYIRMKSKSRPGWTGVIDRKKLF